ncbi:MAG TPA: TPM domain-containing protein [Bacteroidia bacterium]|nr:TPM domain-containing protein [Bacteroidia bacterium]
MKTYIKKIISLFVFIWLAFGTLYAQNNKDLPAKPNPPRLVNDFANVLSGDQVQMLESKLVAYDDSTSTQITIVIMPSVDDDIAEFGARLGDYWGIGRKQKDNGILITISMQPHGVDIATGRGAEGAVTDITSKHIIEQFITPNFRQQNYYQGLDLATTAIMQTMRGEFKADAPANTKDYSKYFILAVVLLFIIFSIFSGGGGKSGHYGSGGFWPLMFLGGGGSGSGFGGGGGGGFGGFGGGSFGGGGASGSW